MTLTLLESIQGIVREELRRVRTAELATVQELHPHADASDTDNYACTVALRNSGVVLAHVPIATGRIGAVSVPVEGELVLVQFVGGDVNAPVITDRLYSDAHRPPPSKAGEAVLHLPLDAADDEAVHVALTSGDTRELVLKLGKGLALTLRDGSPAVELDVNDGKAKLSIEQDGALTLESGAAVTLKGAEITVESDGKLVLKGSKVEIN